MRGLPIPAPPRDSADGANDQGVHAVCLLALRDPDLRAEISDELRSKGWDIVSYASPFHVLATLSDSILGNQAWPPAGLIIVDSVAPGCRGTTLAQGLRDLGADIPVLVVEGDRLVHAHRLDARDSRSEPRGDDTFS